MFRSPADKFPIPIGQPSRLFTLVQSAAQYVYDRLQRGYEESIYVSALAHKTQHVLAAAGLTGAVVTRERHAPVMLDGLVIGDTRADLYVQVPAPGWARIDGDHTLGAETLVIEAKAVPDLSKIAGYQLAHYMRDLRCYEGMLVNFGAEQIQIVRQTLTV